MKSMKMLVLYKRDFYSRRSVWRAQPHHIAYKSIQQLDWASPSAQSQGEDSHCWSVQPCFAPVFRRENYEQNAEQGPERVAQSWHPKSDRGRCQTGNSSAVAMHRRVTLVPGVQGSFVPSRVAHTIYSWKVN